MKKSTIEEFFNFLDKEESRRSLYVDVHFKNRSQLWNGSEVEEEEVVLSRTKGEIILPENLTIHGDFSLWGSSIKKLSKGLKVFGMLYLTESSIEELPDDLQAEYVILREVYHPVKLPVKPRFLNLNIDQTIGISPPEGFTLLHTLSCKRCPSLSLPNDMTVGFLDCRESPLHRLPDNLIVKRDLDIRFTEVSEIPINLKVGGDVLMRGTPLSQGLFKKYERVELLGDLAAKIKEEVREKGGEIEGKVIMW